MKARQSILVGLLLLTSCTGVRSVQLRPPTPAPPGFLWGYGVEKVGKDAGFARQSAHMKAIADLLTRGPVLISKTVDDRTSVLNMKSATRTMESSFRLRASQMLQPSYIDSGVEDGFMWVLVGTTEEDIERGWQQFLEWRSRKIEHAQTLLQTAVGPDRLPILQTAFAILEEAGAQDDPSLVFYRVKAALDAEISRVAQLEDAQKRFRASLHAGRLAAADQALNEALASGLDQTSYQRFQLDLRDRRTQAAHLIAAGDALFHDQKYKEAFVRYQEAERIERDNPHLPAKLAMADRYHRTARGQTIRSTVTMVGWGATRILGEYLEYKKEEEARKRAEAEEAAEKARLEAEREEERDRERKRVWRRKR